MQFHNKTMVFVSEHHLVMAKKKNAKTDLVKPDTLYLYKKDIL